MATGIINNPVETSNPVRSIESMPLFVYRNQPVVTSSVLAGLYGTDQKRIRENFRMNSERFTEGKHFFKVEGKEYAELREYARNSGSLGIAAYLPRGGSALMLWTARGSGRHAKMLNTDKAWDVFEDMEEGYFSRQQAPASPTGTLTAPQQQEIKELVQAKASVFPDAVKPKVFSQVWMRLQRKFKVPRYAELPASLFGEARDYIIAMQIRSVDAPALAETETQALPPARTRNTLDDYKALFKELPDSPSLWLDLMNKTYEAAERFGREIEAIRDEATKPFRVGRKSMVQTYFDASMSPVYSLFDAAREDVRSTYRLTYDALEGCRDAWLLLHKG